jgi:HAD superfamily hydrolase (TIGR01549 family)
VPVKTNTPPEPLIQGAGAFIFDLDGTLYDTGGFARRLVLARPGEALLMLAERKTRKILRGCDYGTPEAYDREFFSRMSRIAKKPAETLRAWYNNRYMPLMIQILRRQYRPRPGAAELLRALAGRSFPFAVYSDYPRTTERLSALGLEAAASKTYGPEHFGAQKPAVRPFLIIAQDLGVPPARVLVIGDRDDTDGAGAAAAGMGYAGTGTPRRGQPDPPFDWKTLAALLRDPPL